MKERLGLKSGDKLPIQHREFRINREKIDRENRSVEILFSTDDPADRWYGKEILSHEAGAVDLTRLLDGAAFLKDHDDTKQIGVHESARIEFSNVNGKMRGEGRAVVRFAPATNPLAEQEFQDLCAGVRTKISVGYVAHAMRLVEEDEDGNETWMVTKWEPLENSLVAIPLDPSCAAGRAYRQGEKEFPVEIDETGRRSEKNLQKREFAIDSDPNQSQKRETPPPANKVMDETPEQKAAREKKEAEERQSAINEGIRIAREREAEINAIVLKANKNLPKDEIAKAIAACATDERAVDNFRKLVFEKYYGDAKPVDVPSSDGSGDIRVIGERGLTIGAQFVTTEAFKRAAAGRGQGGKNVQLDIPISMLGIRGKVEMAKRAGFTSSDLSAINIAPQKTLVALGVQRLTIMDLLAGGATGAAAIPYPRENSYGSLDGVNFTGQPRGGAVGERGNKPIWEPDLTTKTANVKKVAVLTKVPDEFMADFPGFQSYIDERMPFMVDMETEFQILYGDGLGNNLEGITTAAGIQTRAYATTWGDTIFKALTDIRVGSFFEPDGIAMHPYDWETARLEKDDNDQYLGGGPFYIPYGNGVFMELNTFWGKPVAVTTSVTAGKPIVGAWRLGAQYFLREGMRLETTNSNEDDFRKNLVAIRAEHRLALATYRPVAFLEVTGGPARS